jgi:hypothetical protein
MKTFTILGICAIIAILITLRKEVLKVKEQLDLLRVEVAREADLLKSAKMLIQGLADQISANAQNPEGLAELVTSLRSQDDDFAAALKANTPTPAPAPEQPTV